MKQVTEEGTGMSDGTVQVAEASAGEGGTTTVKAILAEVIQTVLLTLVIFMAVRSVVQNFKVEGGSMDPTLHTGQYLLINKLAYFKADGTPLDRFLASPAHGRNGPDYLFGGPQRGDIVVFRFPGNPDKDFIKRIIGLPGETVKIQDGQVYINGTPLNEPYIRDHASYNLPNQVVPPGYYFVLGDNRPNSSDSHVWGDVPANNLIGKAWISYWPPKEWGVVPTIAYARR